MSKKVLLTGIGGFIGAHCLRYWLEKTDWKIIGIDSFYHKGWITRVNDAIKGIENDFNTRVKIFPHDLNVPLDEPLVNKILERNVDGGEKPIDYIINMASDSAVERSVSNPEACWNNNCNLIFNMLEFARKVNPKVFIQVSTDEVYGEAEPAPHPGHVEWDTILPSNPYAASKAAQEALAIAYWRTYNLPVVITNCMNIIGEWQNPEKFLPKVIQSVFTGATVPIYAEQEESNWNIGSRVYLDARNKADALKFITDLPVARYEEGAKLPDRYHIAGSTEMNNLELAQLVAKLIGKDLNYELVKSSSYRPGYDRRYMLDNSKLKELGWDEPIVFEETIKRIVGWIHGQNEHWIV